MFLIFKFSDSGTDFQTQNFWHKPNMSPNMMDVKNFKCLSLRMNEWRICFSLFRRIQAGGSITNSLLFI